MKQKSLFLVLALMTIFGTISFHTVSAEISNETMTMKKQIMSGIDIHKIQCKDGYDLVLKASDCGLLHAANPQVQIN